MFFKLCEKISENAHFSVPILPNFLDIGNFFISNLIDAYMVHMGVQEVLLPLNISMKWDIFSMQSLITI